MSKVLEGYILLEGYKVLRHIDGEVDIVVNNAPEKIVEKSNIETWIELSKTNIVRKLVTIYDNGEHYRNISSLAGNYGNVKEYTRYAGTGEDDIGAGVKWATYFKYFYFPISVSRKVILNVYNKFELPIEEYTRPFIQYDEVKVKETGYGMYNHPVWVTVTEMDNLGNEYGNICGHVFSGDLGYRVGNNVSGYKYFQVKGLDYEYFLERTIYRYLCNTNEDYKTYEKESNIGRENVKKFKLELNELLLKTDVKPTVIFDTTGWGMLVNDDGVELKQNICSIFEALKFKPSNNNYEKGIDELYNHLLNA